MDDIFVKIIAREIPAHFVYEDDVCVAILDKFPMHTGQVLVIPKEKVDYVFDLDDETYHHLFTVAKKIGPVLDNLFDAVRTCIVVEGLEVPHVHIRLHPLQKDKLGFGDPQEASDKILAKQAEQIKAALV
ncbi:MAG: HIT family protein [Candidatus Pacebacteria bacterium]|nr:HIT family protein [Candidatus Paceibacterota bacterium]